MNFLEKNNVGEIYAIIDVGSNSVRLVLYNVIGKSFIPIHNEKVLAGLGRNVSETGILSEKGAEVAINAIKRYRILIESLGIKHIYATATAACRDAKNGKEFLEYIHKLTGLNIRLISGEDEGRLSALGVRSGVKTAEGVMGDLGGSSVELVNLNSDLGIKPESWQLGPLAIGNMATKFDIENIPALRSKIIKILDKSEAIKSFKNKPFHAVGGAWRNLAQIHMFVTKYPLQVLNNYTIPADEALKFCEFILPQSRKYIESIKGVSSRRADTIPYAAMLLSEIIQASKCSEVVISSFGLREGILIEKLVDKLPQNPLIASVKTIIGLDDDVIEFADSLKNWILPIFQYKDQEILGNDFEELLYACCLVCNIGMNFHPDHKETLAYDILLRAPYSCATHKERAFIARSVTRKYGSKSEDMQQLACISLLNEKEAKIADAFGAAMRLGTMLAANSAAILNQTRLEIIDNKPKIIVPDYLQGIISDSINKRLKQLEQSLEKLKC